MKRFVKLFKSSNIELTNECRFFPSQLTIEMRQHQTDKFSMIYDLQYEMLIYFGLRYVNYWK